MAECEGVAEGVIGGSGRGLDGLGDDGGGGGGDCSSYRRAGKRRGLASEL